MNCCPCCGARIDVQVEKRTLQVAELILGGLSNAEIGARLKIEERTVKKYVGKLLRFHGKRNRVELAVKLYQLSLQGKNPE